MAAMIAVMTTAVTIRRAAALVLDRMTAARTITAATAAQITAIPAVIATADRVVRTTVGAAAEAKERTTDLHLD